MHGVIKLAVLGVKKACILIASQLGWWKKINCFMLGSSYVSCNA